MTRPLWRPDPATWDECPMGQFAARLARHQGVQLADYPALHRWSLENSAAFWSELWDFAGLKGAAKGRRLLDNPTAMPGARFFPDARLNFAEELLHRQDDAPAIIFRGEDGSRRQLSFAELHAAVSRLSQALCAAGLKPGDPVAGWLPNGPEAVIAMLATAALGGVWSSASPDFGVAGVLDRFGQVRPKFLFAADSYPYGGKRHDCMARLAQIADALPDLVKTIIIPAGVAAPDLLPIAHGVPWDDFIAPFAAGAIGFVHLPFDHPLYIMFSSGTTGAPKCIIHGAGGTLLQHIKEHRLHCGLGRDQRIFYFTTCGWMMWNWLVSALASGCCLILYDGNPFHPGPESLWAMAQQEGVEFFGTSAKYLDALAKAGHAPRASHDLSRIRMIASTGSPLSPEGFDFVHDAIGDHVHLASISGGTDIISCFVLGNPWQPVWRGEIQGPGLGMHVAVFDDEGRAVTGQPGELVCLQPFPSMPLGFLNDPDGSRYHDAYFARFEGVWCHGDWATQTDHGGFVIHGRSDATLNPGGVRIGTAEIYRQVEQVEDVLESIAVGQDWQGDQRVVLFVRLRAGRTLDAALEQAIRARIRAGASPRHVPARIIQVNDIPRTRSGKITELAVRAIIHGRPVRNVEALANPEALAEYSDLPQLTC